MDWIVGKVSKTMKDAEALSMEVIYEKENMLMYFNFQEREKNVIASSPWIDEVYEPLGFFIAVNNGIAMQIHLARSKCA